MAPLKFPKGLHRETPKNPGLGCNKSENSRRLWLSGWKGFPTLLENSSPIFRQHEMLSLPRFGHFPARKTAAGKSTAPSATPLDFSSETATAFRSFFRSLRNDFSTTKFALSKSYCRGVSNEKQRLDDLPLYPPSPPPQKAKILFLLSSRRLWAFLSSSE